MEGAGSRREHGRARHGPESRSGRFAPFAGLRPGARAKIPRPCGLPPGRGTEHAGAGSPIRWRTMEGGWPEVNGVAGVAAAARTTATRRRFTAEYKVRIVAVALQVSDDRPAVLRTVVALDEAGHHQPARRIVMDRDQHLVARSPVLQPRMHRAVPLLQLAQRRPPRTPAAVLGPSALPLPQAGLHHPAPQRVRAHPQGEASLQVLGKQRRPEVPVQRFPRDFQRPLSKPTRQRPVRPPPAQSVHYGRIALSLELPAQPAKMPSRHPDPRRSRSRAQHSLLHLSQHRDAIPLLQTQVHLLLSRIRFRR